MTSQTHENLIFEDYMKSRPFLKKIKEAPLGNMLIFLYNDFQQLFCKILWENWPVVKLLNVNELFLSQNPYYMSDCIWHKNISAETYRHRQCFLCEFYTLQVILHAWTSKHCVRDTSKSDEKVQIKAPTEQGIHKLHTKKVYFSQLLCSLQPMTPSSNMPKAQNNRFFRKSVFLFELPYVNILHVLTSLFFFNFGAKLVLIGQLI